MSAGFGWSVKNKQPSLYSWAALGWLVGFVLSQGSTLKHLGPRLRSCLCCNKAVGLIDVINFSIQSMERRCLCRRLSTWVRQTDSTLVGFHERSLFWAEEEFMCLVYKDSSCLNNEDGGIGGRQTKSVQWQLFCLCWRAASIKVL